MAQQDSKRVSRMAAENGNGGGGSTDGHKQASGRRQDAGEGPGADQNSSTSHNASPQDSEGHSSGTGLNRDAGQGNDKGLQHLVHDTDLAKAVNAAPRSSTPPKKISPASKEAKPAEVAAVLDETGSIIPEEEIISVPRSPRRRSRRRSAKRRSVLKKKPASLPA